MVLVENLAYGSAYFQVRISVKIGKRGTHRPFRPVKAVAVEKHDCRFIGQTDYEVKGLIIIVEVIGEIITINLFCLDHEVYLTIISGAVGVGKQLESCSAPQIVQTLVDHSYEFWLQGIAVQEGERGEQCHLYLLRSR